MSSGRRLGRVAFACALAAGSAAAQGGVIHGSVSVPGPGISGVAVYLVPASGVHTAPSPVTVEMDQRDLRFVPRVLAVPPGSTVSFPNSDSVMHNVFHPSVHGGSFDLGTYPQGERRSFTFVNEGAYVIFCHVHPEMIGYVVVVASRWRAVSDENGRFRIDDVAPGTYHLRTWHRRLRTVDQLVTVTAGGAVRVHLPLGYGFPVEPRAAGPGTTPAAPPAR